MGKDEKIKVLYLFDRYLNSTMNWAERWMQHLTGAKIFIAAPLIIKNEYYKPQYNFIKSPFQYTLPSSEKQVPR
ncbi:MAG: hypothetical protein KDC24_06370, partial [Saprospiraceae bacterium]|nr:hypothetical protein [Saprospiraceae bacterium]